MELINGATFIVAIQLGVVALLNIFNRVTPNRLLGVLLLIFLLSVKYFLFDYIGVDWLIRFFRNLSSSQFYGPVFFLFLLAVANDLRRKNLLEHLAFPIFLGLFYQANDYWEFFPHPKFLKTYILLEYGLIFFYFALSWRFFKHGRLDHIKVKRRYWLFYLVVFADLIYNFGELAFSIFWPDTHTQLMPGLFHLDMVIYLLIFLYLILFGLTELTWVRKLFVPKTIYFATGQVEESQIAERLEQLFEEKEIHLNPELTLNDLAKEVGVSRTVLSEYLTIKKSCSFNDLLNQYRLETFKTILQHPDYAHLDIIGIAYASGFGSKATFYRVFKQMEGMTPSAFRKSQKKGE